MVVTEVFNLFDCLRDEREGDSFCDSPAHLLRDGGFVGLGSYSSCNIYINDITKDLALEFAVAGISKDKISLTTEGDYLYLEIEKCEREMENFSIVKRGIKSSHIKRKFYIPMSKYHLETIDIKLMDGILRILVSAKEEIKPKKLKIN